MTHQPARSFSIASQHPFNRAGERTSNVREDMEIYHQSTRVSRFSAESVPSLLLGLCASALSSFRRVSGDACVLGFHRVFVESPAWAVSLDSAESLRGPDRRPTFPAKTFLTRTSREWQPARTSIVFFGA